MSKRKRQAILFFTYGFMTLATIVITAVCLLLVLGYRFDIKDKRIEQGGLVQLRSLPEGARVTLDADQLGSLTPTKHEVSAGMHTITMSRDGYTTWQKTVAVKAGELRWLDYARLVPTKLTTNTVASAEKVAHAEISPNREYIAALVSGAPLSVVIYDVRDPAKVTAKTYPIPEGLITTQDGVPIALQLVEWDKGSRYVLLVATAADSVYEYVLLDRSAADGAVRNITTEFNLPFRQMHFAGTSGAHYLALTGGDLRKVDIGAKSVSQPLVANVESVVVYDETAFAYVATSPTQKIAGIYKNDTAKSVRSLSRSEPVWVDYTRYFYHDYVAIGSRTHVDIIKDPIANSAQVRTYATLSLPYEINWLRFSEGGRMMTAGNGRAFGAYDLETNEHYFVNTDEAASDSVPMWLDDYYLIDNPTGTTRIYEFDGTNRHDITTCDQTLPAGLSANQKFLYCFGKDGEKKVLRSTALTID